MTKSARRQPQRQRQPTPEGGAPSLREEHKRLTRNRLVDAAVAVFEEVGFEEATVEQIVRRAGTTRSTFYLHFKAKEDLYHAINQRIEPAGALVYEHLGQLENPSVADLSRWLQEVEQWAEQLAIYLRARNRAISVTPSLAADWIRTVERMTSHDEGYLGQFSGEALTAAKTRLVLLAMMLERYVFITQIGGIELDYPKAREVLAGMIRDLLWTKSEAPVPATGRKSGKRRQSGG